MDPEVATLSLDNSSYVMIKKMSAENRKQIELTDNLLKNSALNVIIDKFNTDDVLKNQQLTEEIEKTVLELLKENAKLKETLQQTNTSMKDQLTTFTKLQEEVFKIHQSHKQKFEETKELVLKLRTENQELKKPTLGNGPKVFHRTGEGPHELLPPREKPPNPPHPPLKKCSDPRCAHFKSDMAAENRVLKQKLNACQQELCELKQHITMNSRSDKEQEYIQVIGDLTKQLENAERCKRKLTLDVDRLSAQELKLQRILANGESKNVTDCCYWNAIFPTAVISAPFEAQLVENLKRLEELLSADDKFSNDSPDSSSSSKSPQVSDSSWVKVKAAADEQTLQLIKSDVKLCYKLLSQEQALNANRKQLIDNARSKFKDIYKQCLTILKEHDTRMKAQEIESVKMREKLKDLENLRRELGDKQHRITYLETELNFLENILQKKLQENERKNEDLSILQSQMKVYEEDFLSEREARESLANERDVLEYKVNCLQQQNKELLKELKRSPEDNLEKNMKEHQAKKMLQKNEKKYECFNDTCQESFASEEELQQHVYSCLNIKD